MGGRGIVRLVYLPTYLPKVLGTAIGHGWGDLKYLPTLLTRLVRYCAGKISLPDLWYLGKLWYFLQIDTCLFPLCAWFGSGKGY